MNDEELEAILGKDNVARLMQEVGPAVLQELAAKQQSEHNRDLIMRGMLEQGPRLPAEAATEPVVASPALDVAAKTTDIAGPQPVDPLEIVRKAMTTNRQVEPIVDNVAALNESLTEKVARPTDVITPNSILPFSNNERTGETTFTPLTAGITGDIADAVQLPGKVMANPEEYLSATTDEEKWQKYMGEVLNLGGMATLSSLPSAAMPDTLHMGIKIPGVNKTQMTAVKAKQPPQAFMISDVDIHAPRDLKSLEKPGDLYKTYFIDEKSVLGDLAERAGVPNLQQTRQLIDQDTQASALMRVNEALRSGKLTTTAGSFQVPVSPEALYGKYAALDPASQQNADQYLKLRDYSNDLRLKIAKGIDPQKSAAELATVTQSIADIETTTPVVKDIAQDYRNITEGVRQFLSTGPNALFDQKALQGLQMERPDYVPIDITGVNPNDPLLARISDANKAMERQGMQDWFTQSRDLASINGIDNRVNSFEILLDYTRNALQHKMENDVRGTFIQELKNSKYGSETVRLLKEDEKGKYSDRTVSVYENGKKVDYLMSKLQRDLLQFDPYIARHPLPYAAKRLWEMGTTGPLQPAFAATTMLRDMLTGSALSEKGVAKPGVFGTLAAVPQQIVPKMARQFSEILRDGGMHIPFFDPQMKQQLADQLGQRYARSLYALSNEVGGIDASLMKSNIQAGRGAMREIARSADEVLAKVPGVQTLGHSLKHLAHGWEGIFGAIADAPRFAVFKKQVAAGVNPAEAAVQARRITGDTSRGGRAYMPDGSRILADVENKSALAPSKLAAQVATLARETMPYYNPSIQGLRRLATRLVADPVRTQLNAWKYVGLPGLAAYAWNEMLGPEYNDYAQRNRTDSDIALQMYIGIPGQPPEKGIEFPIGHEMTPWLSPWSTALYNLGRGDEDVGKGLIHSGANVLKNASPVGYPTILTQALALSGIKAPQSILNPMEGVYSMREDNVGLLPQNVEHLSRTIFGTVSDLALMSAAAAYDGGPQAFFDELGWQVGKRAPILKNVIGAKTAVTNFTPKSTELYRKVDSFKKFKQLYDDHFGEDKDVVQSSITGATPETDPSRFKIAPNLTPMPTNPVFKHFGDMVRAYMGSNEEGFTGLVSRENVLDQQVKLLRGYTAGKRDDFKEYQKRFGGAEEEFSAKLKEIEDSKEGMSKSAYEKAVKKLTTGDVGQRAKQAELLREMDIDLSKRSDVNRLINYLELERFKLVSEQVSMIKQLEDRMTVELQGRGILPKGVSFDIEKHLSSTVPRDFLPEQAQERSRTQP